MAQKIYGINDIAQDDDYVAPVVTDDATPEYLNNIDGKAYFSYDDAKVTVDASGTNASKYGVAVLDASDADDLVILNNLKTTNKIQMEVADIQAAFDVANPRHLQLEGLVSNDSGLATKIATLKSDINAVYSSRGLPTD